MNAPVTSYRRLINLYIFAFIYLVVLIIKMNLMQIKRIKIQLIFKIEIIEKQMYKASTLVTAFVVIYLAAFIYNLNNYPIQLASNMEIKVPAQNIIYLNNQSQIIFRHDSIKNRPLIVDVFFSNGTQNAYQSKGQNDHIKIYLPCLRKQITNAVIKVKEQMKQVGSFEKKRLLLSDSTTSNPFLYYSLIGLQTLLELSRNLIFVGIIFNINDIFLPYLIFCETFIMLGFWPGQMNLLSSLYNNIFNSKLDLLNMIRIILSTPSQSTKISAFFRYKFGDLHCINLSGQIFLAVVMLFFTILIKLNPICIKSEKMRKITTRLRSIWNGYFMIIFPRTATYTAFHLILIKLGDYQIVNIITCVLVTAILAVFPIVLLIQARRINNKQQFVDKSRNQIGLVGRYNLQKSFTFDCFECSMLYYPLISYFRMFLFFMSLGLFPYKYYYLYSGPIVAQMFAIMMETSSANYINRRDQILYPMNNFILFLVQLSIITTHVTLSIGDQSVTQIIDYITFSLLILLFSSSLFGAILDLKLKLSENCSKQVKQLDNSNIQNQDTINNENHQRISKEEMDNQTTSKIKLKNKTKFENEDNDNDKQNMEVVSAKKKMHIGNIPSLKIKKMYKGKMV